MDELYQRYAVTLELVAEPDPHGTDLASGQRLIPADPAAGSPTVVFDAFPGLIVRMGPRFEMHVPRCGCDACDETVEECSEQLSELVRALTDETFGSDLSTSTAGGTRRGCGPPTASAGAWSNGTA